MSAEDFRIALSGLLSALGFTQMADDVLHETDEKQLRRYAKIIFKNSPFEKKENLRSSFMHLGLM